MVGGRDGLDGRCLWEARLRELAACRRRRRLPDGDRSKPFPPSSRWDRGWGEGSASTYVATAQRRRRHHHQPRRPMTRGAAGRDARPAGTSGRLGRLRQRRRRRRLVFFGRGPGRIRRAHDDGEGDGRTRGRRRRRKRRRRPRRVGHGGPKMDWPAKALAVSGAARGARRFMMREMRVRVVFVTRYTPSKAVDQSGRQEKGSPGISREGLRFNIKHAHVTQARKLGHFFGVFVGNNFVNCKHRRHRGANGAPPSRSKKDWVFKFYLIQL